MRAKQGEESEFTTALTKVRRLASETRAERVNPAFLDVGPLRPMAEPRTTELEVTRRDVVVRLRLPTALGPAELARLVRKLTR
jgi:hypothetical protein